MSPKQRILRAGLTAALALATVVGLTVSAGAAAGPATGGHAAAAVADRAVSSGRAAADPRVSPPPIQSQNWAGYLTVQPTGSVNAVSATFQLPALSSSCGTSSSSPNSPVIGVGIDGDTSSTFEFGGFAAVCNPLHFASCLPNCPVPPSPSPYGNPGDLVQVTVSYLGGGNQFKDQIQDLTQGWAKSADFSVATTAQRSTAEAIVMDSATGSLVPLSNFGMVAFHSASVNSQSLSALNPTPVTMISTSGSIMAVPTTISGSGTFSVNWVSPGP